LRLDSWRTSKSYAWIVKSTALVNHYYFYCVDRDFGPFFLKFCSYFPYGGKLCLNGHEYAKRQLERGGIGFQRFHRSRIRWVLVHVHHPWHRSVRHVNSFAQKAFGCGSVALGGEYNEASRYRQIKSFVECYHETRTHLSLQKDASMSRPALDE
jgi:hypothetical protein